MVEEFSSITELYQRLLPALKTKSSEMKRKGYPYITEEDIWNYLKEKKWKLAQGLSLYQMVDDILHGDDVFIDDYVKSQLKRMNRRAQLEEVEGIYETK